MASTQSFYPFNLDGPLCPLLNDRELLSSFYEEAGFRQAIKQFCKRTAWAGKPVISFSVDPEKLKELVLSLFNSPAAREKFRQQCDDGDCPYLHNAIWQWLSAANPALLQRVTECCNEVKDRLFIQGDALEKLLGQIQMEKPDAPTLTQLACVVLAFAMLQPDDRQRLGGIFLAAFPEFAEKFGAV